MSEFLPGDLPDVVDLSYLADPGLMNFSKEFFGSLGRLPLGGAIYELTPIIDQDVVHFAQVEAVLPHLER